MNKRSMFRNKMMLGFLTLGDLREIVKIEGEASLGRFWIAIDRTKKRKDCLQVFLSGGLSEFEIPLDSIVKVEGNIVRIDLDRNAFSLAYKIPGRFIEVRFRLYEEPFPETF